MKTKTMKKKMLYAPSTVEIIHVITEGLIAGSINKIVIDGPEWEDGGTTESSDIILL